jgi:hypothetical protein
MTTQPHEHDQDSEPPTPDNAEPDTEQLDPHSEPASHPDPDLEADGTESVGP